MASLEASSHQTKLVMTQEAEDDDDAAVQRMIRDSREERKRRHPGHPAILLPRSWNHFFARSAIMGSVLSDHHDRNTKCHLLNP
mmetsp:Transcript_28059/g.78691  ORF Transcript_28059/g.78691 Transcript_28059/m.78691 type:complete len:84 (+) Transcript_28059:1-252(+)